MYQELNLSPKCARELAESLNNIIDDCNMAGEKIKCISVVLSDDYVGVEAKINEK